ncbi:MAG: DUF3048 domain-containing protein [Tissierellia bacterium]|nr:DUF3048 domain-containing protein [Tissierellia bacterium]
MKRLWILLLAALLLLGGCNQAPAGTASPTEEEMRAQEEEAKKAEEEAKRKEEEEAKKQAEELEKQAAEEEAKRLEELAKMKKSPLSGLPITEEKLNQRVIAVMIDNHPSARPESGIADAEIVYEYEVESRITRYLALYLGSDAKEVGPIRSARPYYLNTVLEYDAVLARYGGSDEADALVYEYGIDDMDGMKVGGEYIWRDNSKGKVAPHNAYSSTEAVRKYIDAVGYENRPGVGVFSFQVEDTDIEGEPAKSAILYYGSGSTSGYTYDESSKTYLRFVAGAPHMEESNNKQIAAKNIIIQLAPMGFYENGVHRWVELIGEGEGKFLTNGKVMDITWSKSDLNAKTVFKDGNGNEILLNPGQTWVEVFDMNKDYTIE